MDAPHLTLPLVAGKAAVASMLTLKSTNRYTCLASAHSGKRFVFAQLNSIIPQHNNAMPRSG